jgi:hypothetical protein
LYSGMKKKTMQLSLCNEDDNDDDDVKMVASEIQLFPQDSAHVFPNTESEFSVFEWSSYDFSHPVVHLMWQWISLKLGNRAPSCSMMCVRQRRSI